MKNSITLFDLPEDKVGVRFDDVFRKKFFEKFSSESYEKTAERLGTTRETLRRWVTGKRRIPLKIAKTIAADVGANEEELQKRVVELKSNKSKEKITNPRLPFKIISPEFALVVGGVLCDGGIEKGRNRVWYFNNEKQQIDSFISAVETCFGNVGYAFHRSISGTPCVIFPKIIGLVLGCVGLTPGNKNYNFALSVPEQYLECSDEKTISTLLRRMFDDDGTVNDHHNCRATTITFPFVKKEAAATPQTPPVIGGTVKLLEKLGIKPHVWLRQQNKPNGECRLTWIIAATGRENLEKYREKIGFDIPRKREKLDHVLQRYTGKKSYPRNEAKHEYLKVILEMTEDHELITAKTLAKTCERNERHAREVLTQLNQRGLLEKREVNRAFVYSLTEPTILKVT